ncbi:uncharacterized protein LOC131887791 [Tigriopus californicus]|uniref:uncharacterized protein LOC131887791 n=1 Tax=Tigriopus californicus TaxID=6832 RepID=UPI0027DAADA1|nr:uncharacterized protein LOC131887791 [Tigriopus californicus]
MAKDTQTMFKDLTQRYFHWKMKCYPIFATVQGIREYDGLMPDRSLKAVEHNKSQCEQFLRETKGVLAIPGCHLSHKQIRYLNLMIFEVKSCLVGHSLGGHFFPEVNFLEGVQDKLPRYMTLEHFCKLETVEDCNLVLARLSSVSRYCEGMIEALEAGMKAGMTYSIEALSRVPKQFERLQVQDVTQSAFYAPFMAMSKTVNIGQEDVLRIQTEAQNIIKQTVLPGLKHLSTFINDIYSRSIRKSPSISSLPNGDEFYKACLQFHSSVKDLTPEYVHLLGVKLVRELLEGVSKVAKSVGWNGGPQEFLKHVQNDPKQRFQSKAELVEYIQDMIKNKIGPKMKDVIEDRFLTPEFYHVDVEPLPPGNGAMAYYSRASQDGRQKAAFWLNLEKVENFKKFELMSLALHEAIPGHHFHLTLFNQMYGFPDFVKNPVYDDISLSPSRVPFYTAHIEGWGLYSEYLGFEMGLFENPYDLLGYYSWNLLRSVRLVVDTGLHHYNWTREQALTYLTENTALSRRNSEGDIDRYITWPGQSISYKLGQIKILEFREQEQLHWGDKFDLKKFHTRVLARIGPLDELSSSTLEYDES